MTFLFWLLFFSVSFLSVLTSFYFKSGQTVQVILFPLLIISIYFSFRSKYLIEQKNLFRDKFIDKKNVLLLVSGSIFIWLLNAVFVIDISMIFEKGSEFRFLIPSKDAFFYGRLSESLLSSSYETVFALNEDVPTVLGTTPYHYFELWLSAFFSKLFSISGYIAYSLFTLPLLQVCTWVGILAVYEQTNNKLRTFETFLWAIGLLFFAGIYFPFYEFLRGFQATYWLTNTIFTGLSEHYFFWIAVFLSFQKKNYKVCIWVVFMIPIVSPTLWAACWGGVFLMGTILFYQQKTFFIKNNRLEVVSFFLIPVCYLLFYYLTQSAQSVVSSDVSILALSENKVNLLSIFKEIIIYLFAFCVIYIPFLVLFLFYLKRKIRQPFDISLVIYIVFLSGGVLGGISFYFLLPFHEQRFQFLRNFILPFMQVGVIYFFAKNQKYLNIKVKIVFAILLLYGVGFTLHWFYKEIAPNQVYSQEYLSKIQSELIDKKTIKRGAIFHSESFYENKKLFTTHSNFEIEGRYLAFKQGLERFYNLDMPCLNIHKNNNSNSHFETDIFAIWLEGRVCNDSLKWAFVEEQKLDFVIIGKNVVAPKKKQSKAILKIQDSLSGEVCFKLK